jgi:hypothetical protein
MSEPKEWSPFEFKTDPENGCLIGPDGCHYETEQQAFHFAFLGLCGCGSPDEAYDFCRDVLLCFDRRGCHDDPPTKEWIMAEEAVTAIIKERPDQAAHVLAHLLTERKLLEHGGSVGGSWLTKWGEQLVDAGPMRENALSD